MTILNLLRAGKTRQCIGETPLMAEKTKRKYCGMLKKELKSNGKNT